MVQYIRSHRVAVLLIAAGVLATTAFFLQEADDKAPELLVQATRGPFKATVTTSGELKAKNSVKIAGPSNAMQRGLYQIKIEKLIPEGTIVRKGDFVAELDRSEVMTKIQNSQIELDKAQSQHEQTMLDTLLTLSKARDEIINLRYAMEEAQLRKEQARYEAPSVIRQAEIDSEKAERTLQQAMDSYETQVRQSHAKMREVDANLSKTQNELNGLLALAQQFTVTAPENGMVVYLRYRDSKLKEGGTIGAWDPVVAELPDLTSMESVTYINEVDIQKIEVGQRATVGLDASPDVVLTGTVTSVANIGEQRPNSDSKVFQVSILLDEVTPALRPAMTTSNEILVAMLPEALTVPLETVHAQDSLAYVYVRHGPRVVRKQVQLGLMNDNEVVVERGLSEEERIFMSLPPDTSGLAFERLPDEAAMALSDASAPQQ